MRNDELMAEREQDAEGMNEMEAKVQEYKRKFDAVRIELRNLKGQSSPLKVALKNDAEPSSDIDNVCLETTLG